jgi:hypothetical protein
MSGWFLQPTAVLPKQHIPVPARQKAGWCPETVLTFWKTHICSVPDENRTKLLGSPVRSPVTTLSELHSTWHTLFIMRTPVTLDIVHVLTYTLHIRRCGCWCYCRPHIICILTDLSSVPFYFKISGDVRHLTRVGVLGPLQNTWRGAPAGDGGPTH